MVKRTEEERDVYIVIIYLDIRQLYCIGGVGDVQVKDDVSVAFILVSFHHGHGVWTSQRGQDSNDDCNYPYVFRLRRSDALFGIDIRVMTTFGVAVILVLTIGDTGECRFLLRLRRC